MRQYNKIKTNLKITASKKRIRKGVSLAELLIAVAALSILMLGFSEFTAGFFKVSAMHGTQIKNVNYSRYSSERIITSVNKAAYIYPANTVIQLSENTINTNDSVAMLIEDNSGNYLFIAYYPRENIDGKIDLYEYISDTFYSWDKDVCPATDMLSFSGSGNLVAGNIDNESTSLLYILNYNNSAYDVPLKGEIGNAFPDDKFALIKGISWNISQNTSDTQSIPIKGTSRNVPRFFE